MAIAHSVPRGAVTAQLNFYKAPADGSAPFNHVGTPPAGLPERNYSDQRVAVTIEDARGQESEFTLDRDAFEFVQNVAPSAERDFADDASIAANYYPEVEQLLLGAIPGSNRVFIFDHTIRRTDPNAPRGPVNRVHIDQTVESAALRVRRHMGEEADELLQKRYRIVNVWRPLNKNPVESFPLAFASSKTLRDEDVVPVEHRYTNGYTGETAAIQPNKDQKWYYWSGMTGNERILIECFDSEALKEGSGVDGGRVAHTAFEHPGTREGAEGRESIEVRALVFGP